MRVSAEIEINITQNSYIFLHSNDCETPYIDIYVGLLLTTFVYCSCFCMVFTI